jgi:hypothetical protein
MEMGDGEDDPSIPGKRIALDDYEIASRLSYFLWKTMPDATLFAAADEGRLTDPAHIADQVDRMLADSRAEDAVASYHRQWLGIGGPPPEKDRTLFAEYSTELWNSMRAESERFAASVILEGDARLATLLTASWTIADPALDALYGLTPDPDDDAADPFRRVELPAGERSGLLTHASVLAAHAKPDESSTIYRGLLVRTGLLCGQIPPPPDDIDTTAPVTERLDNPYCAACHVLFDPIGLGLEQYDAIGRYRTEVDGTTVDASGEIVGSGDADGTFYGAVELGRLLASSPSVARCAAKQWALFALGRALDEDSDPTELQQIEDAFVDSDGDIRLLLRAIAGSDAFVQRVVPRAIEDGNEED